MMKSTTQASLIAEYKKLLGDCVAEYNNHSIYHSELFFFWRFAKKYNVERIVESGTYHGSSIARLRKLFPDAELITFELRKGHYKRIQRVENVDYRLGELKNNLKLIKDNTVVLIDGPKRKNAVRLAGLCLRHGALFVAMHDMYDQMDYLNRKFKYVEHSGKQPMVIRALDSCIEIKSPSKKYYGPTLSIVGK